MAALLYIKHWDDRGTVVDEVFKAAKEAEDNRKREYDAAIHIQAVMRGVRLRQFVKYLHMCAVRIQMAWRGYLGRKSYYKHLAIKVEQQQLDCYHAMATKIKAIWKGHYVRTRVYDFYGMKRYLLALQEKNEVVRARLREYELEMRDREELERELKALEEHDQYARSCHFMVSTKVQAGVFKKAPGEFENHINDVFLGELSQSKKNKTVWHKKPGSHKTELPPLKRVQGPFKQPGVVYLQRHKNLKPTLRVQTDFTSEEVAREKEKQDEWCRRAIDEKFAPFSKMQYSYIPSLDRNTQFSNVTYGTKTFRELPIVRSVESAEFKTVFKGIPEFDKLGETYS